MRLSILYSNIYLIAIENYSYVPVYFCVVVVAQGSVYLSGHGSEERMSLVPLHDEASGVIASMKCFGSRSERLLPQKNVDYCDELEARFGDHEYGSLMNTTFGLVPAGRSPGTYRLGEVMSAGAIPVFVARDIVRPFREQVDWPSFSFVFAPDEVGPAMVRTLRAVPREALREMQVNTGAYQNYIFRDNFRPCDV